MMYGKSKKGYFKAKDPNQPAMAGEPANAAAAAGVNSQTGSQGGPGDEALMGVWNTYVDWLNSKGLKGDPSLDKGGRGMQMVEMFNNEMKQKDPSFLPLQSGDIGRVQELLKDYRSFAMDQIRQGNGLAKLSDGSELKYSQMNQSQKDEFENIFMQDIAKTPKDEIPGQFTTRVQFPEAFRQARNSQGQNVGERVRLGYAPTTNVGQRQ